ncbi:putative allantoinase 1 [Psilocybe cubensis]|uniref:Oxo-4-hydroxy-4-carboxy-5-ureidoimidazoline decarboxylase domain-containing protein n=2 Tax=Psilocybe cubensis TaxID=181762 RepID=A0A8H7XTF4_PSICU|nr:putative allantoinase 1 [Psilocybe cubensis]KAH9479516.1 putative allantoinase 1 [Psilocybe cubensis]
MSALPAIEDIQTEPSGPSSPLAVALEVLFERSPILINVLEPQLSAVLKSKSSVISYTDLINDALEEIEKWDVTAQSEFISGHPRIGESKNLSTLSASEQGAQGLKPTPPEVLARLQHLNACYERKYPGLRYITFVNGRNRAAIAEEMESMLGISHSLSDVDPEVESISPIDVEGDEWRKELSRAVYDVGQIAKSRLGALGVH